MKYDPFSTGFFVDANPIFRLSKAFCGDGDMFAGFSQAEIDTYARISAHFCQNDPALASFKTFHEKMGRVLELHGHKKSSKVYKTAMALSTPLPEMMADFFRVVETRKFERYITMITLYHNQAAFLRTFPELSADAKSREEISKRLQEIDKEISALESSFWPDLYVMEATNEAVKRTILTSYAEFYATELSFTYENILT